MLWPHLPVNIIKLLLDPQCSPRSVNRVFGVFAGSSRTTLAGARVVQGEGDIWSLAIRCGQSTKRTLDRALGVLDGPLIVVVKTIHPAKANQIHLSLPGRECGPTRCLPRMILVFHQAQGRVYRPVRAILDRDQHSPNSVISPV